MTDLSGCVRGRRRTAPHHGDSRAELVDTPVCSRVNGWSRPLHGLQLIAWVMYSFMAVVGFAIFLPLLPAPWSFTAYALTGGAFLLHLVSHVAAVSIDPADVSVRRRKNYSSPMPVFDSTKHQHVIDNLHCTLCEVEVGLKAKHCSSCNKCIADFDHHCKWLNNCVGGRNYWFFFSSICSAVVGVTVLITAVLFVFIQVCVNPGVLRTAPQFQTLKSNGTWLMFLPAAPLETSSISLLALAFITVLLALAALLLLSHLLCFHIYLLIQGISTYEYIVRKRQSHDPRENPPAPPSDPPTAQGRLESPVPSSSCSIKLEDRGPAPGRLPEPICAEMEESVQRRVEFRSRSPAQRIPGEPVMSLPVSLSGIEKPQAPGRSDVKLVVQDPLGSSIMVVPQHLLTDTRPG